VCISQWYVPAAMIVEQEDILRNGKTFRFKTAPVDPTDPFRGKYITLNFEADTYKHNNDRKWERGKHVFVLLTEGNDGFAKILDLSESLPDSDSHYVEGKVLFSDEDIVRISYPFERFYLEESKALGAEIVYRESNRNDSTQTAYAVVHIKNGKPALEDVMINDRSIVDIVRELNNGKKN
jgi:uncharacterized membrane-anchored protein